MTHKEHLHTDYAIFGIQPDDVACAGRHGISFAGLCQRVTIKLGGKVR